MPSVGGGAAQVVDRVGGGGAQLAEPGRDLLVDGAGRERSGQERLGLRRPQHRRAGRADRRPDPPGRVEVERERRDAVVTALRPPIFENTCGPRATGMSTASTSSSGASDVRFGPSRKSPIAIVRPPRCDATSMTASTATSGGSASPAGEAVARLPPTVPRLRICGEPSVRAACARPGSWPDSSAISRAYGTPRRAGRRRRGAPSRAARARPVRSIMRSGRRSAAVHLDHHVGAAGDRHGVGVAGAQVEGLGQRSRTFDDRHAMPPAKIARTVSMVSASSGRLSGR